jgi:hypothetical protein
MLHMQSGVSKRVCIRLDHSPLQRPGVPHVACHGAAAVYLSPQGLARPGGSCPFNHENTPVQAAGSAAAVRCNYLPVEHLLRQLTTAQSVGSLVWSSVRKCVVVF